MAGGRGGGPDIFMEDRAFAATRVFGPRISWCGEGLFVMCEPSTTAHRGKRCTTIGLRSRAIRLSTRPGRWHSGC